MWLMLGATANEVHDLLSDRGSSRQRAEGESRTVIYDDHLVPARTNRDLSNKTLVGIGERNAHDCLKALITNVPTLVKVDANPRSYELKILCFDHLLHLSFSDVWSVALGAGTNHTGSNRIFSDKA